MHQSQFKFEKTRRDSEQRRRSLYLKFSRYAEISVTGLSSHSFAILPSKNLHNFQTQVCSVSCLFLLILPSKINASVHGLQRRKRNKCPPRPTLPLLEMPRSSD